MTLIYHSLCRMQPSQTAEAFATVMIQGFPEYGCRVKQTKTCVNFKVVVPGTLEPLPRLGRGEIWLRWCGLRINTKNLSLMADYSRFITASQIEDKDGHPGTLTLLFQCYPVSPSGVCTCKT